MYYEAIMVTDQAKIRNALSWLLEAETILNNQYVNITKLNFDVLLAIRNIYAFLNQTDEVKQYDIKIEGKRQINNVFLKKEIRCIIKSKQVHRLN